MKRLSLILSLFFILLINARAETANSSLELVLHDERVSFPTSHITMELSLRNVGDTSMNALDLVSGLSIVWDGQEYKRDPKRWFSWDGPTEFQQQTSMRARINLADYLIPQVALTPGKHSVAAKTASSKSNKLTVYIGLKPNSSQTSVVNEERASADLSNRTPQILVDVDESFSKYFGPEMLPTLEKLIQEQIEKAQKDAFRPK